ncbi:uncharacterized protein BCR38DRAFT_437098 [Pseudomassariella vexata]|uniref:Nudix hydrolase domain-containing protein n=1 Tax=Pseudomassariella vexata TaxID=1141098 RepID=A0A1Y2DWM4_9PEZI|nr:uncharacterized protein BCR38DRAFT_437098 [Pseudomassariella vexata]ORY63536.1 hypothetical protein BCR38DRAFT_437098 [Pseudomassariella vexata]
MALDQDKITLEDWLDDLCVRFIINLPAEDLSSVERICFQVEEAHWFYEDFIRTLDPALPNMQLKAFSELIFKHCPILSSFSEANRALAFDQFMQYKQRVPVRGAILLNSRMDSLVLVRGWKKQASWSFPRGKINKAEDDLECAIREAYEETGYDLRAAGLVEDKPDFVEATMRDQHLRLYIFHGVPDDTHFEPQTRKEIGDIQWYKISQLPAFRKNNKKGAAAQNTRNEKAVNPNKFYMVAPFLVPLRKVIREKKQAQLMNATYSGNPPQMLQDDVFTEDDMAPNPLKSSAPPAPAPGTEYLDRTEKELQRQLQIQPPTEGLQTDTAYNVNPNAGAALMSLLQPKAAAAATSQAPPANNSYHYYPHTPLDHTIYEPAEPQTPHRHHPTQQMHVNVQERPPQFPIVSGNHGFHEQQYYHRPQIRMDSNGQPNVLTSRQYQNQPVQILHPQPQHPQVQQSLLMQGVPPTPTLPENTAPHQTQGNQGFIHSHQPDPSSAQINSQEATTGPRTAPQPSAQTTNLLEMLKGNARQAISDRQPSVQSQADYRPILPQHQQQQQQQMGTQNQKPTRYSNQYGVAASSMSPQIAPASPGSRPLPPTDKHRSGLLGMFKKVESPKAPSYQPTVDMLSLFKATESPRAAVPQNNQPTPDLLSLFKGTESPRAAVPRSNQPTPDLLSLFKGTESPRAATTNSAGLRQSSNGGPKQQASDKPSSMANILQTAVQENGRPMVMNPNSNLPFGAVMIARRPKDGKSSADLGQEEILKNAHAPQVRQSSLEHASSGPRGRQSARNLKGQPAPAPANEPGYPYGKPDHPTNSSTAHGPPASALPMPHMLKRSEQSSEHKTALLSLFNQTKTSGAALPPKGKEAAAEQLGSIGSTPGNRRGSGTLLSPADREFLLGFLQDASKNAPGTSKR